MMLFPWTSKAIQSAHSLTIHSIIHVHDTLRDTGFEESVNEIMIIDRKSGVGFTVRKNKITVMSRGAQEIVDIEAIQTEYTRRGLGGIQNARSAKS